MQMRRRAKHLSGILFDLTVDSPIYPVAHREFVETVCSMRKVQKLMANDFRNDKTKYKLLLLPKKPWYSIVWMEILRYLRILSPIQYLP